MSKSTHTPIIALVLILLGTSLAGAAFDGTSWQFSRDVTVPAASEFIKITLPDTVSRTSSNFADVRIITHEGIEVPYFLTKNAVVRGGEVAGKILNQTTNGGVTSFVVDVGSEGVVRTGIRIGTSVANFRRQVRVYSASTLLPIDGSGWNLVSDKGFLFKFTDPNTGFTSGKDSMDFPPNTSRYIKVVIESGPEGAVNVSGVSLFGDRRIDIPSYKKDVPVSVFNNPDRKTTEVTVDLGESGHITDAITLESTDRNYSRRVVIEVADTADATTVWQRVGEGSISNITTDLFTGASNRITYAEQKTRYIRLSIVNDDNRPLALGSTAHVEGPIVSAIFETRPGESYRLFYGNPSAYTPTYDIARISSYIEANALPAGILGAEVANPLYVAPLPPVIPFTESNPWLFNTILVIVVLIIAAGIGWYLYSYVKKHKSGPDDGAGFVADGSVGGSNQNVENGTNGDGADGGGN